MLGPTKSNRSPRFQLAAQEEMGRDARRVALHVHEPALVGGDGTRERYHRSQVRRDKLDGRRAPYVHLRRWIRCVVSVRIAPSLSDFDTVGAVLSCG